MKLLIVDDSERVRVLIKRMLGGLCEAIYECADGMEALAAYDKFQPDWVLMDIRMQKLNGVEATRQIVTAHQEARVVIVTNYDDERMRETARAAGAYDYVLKEDLSTLTQVLTAPP
jgi:two-component system response regulator DegU